MYISGTLYNFEPRLHQLPTGRADIDNFRIEGGGYVATTPQQETKWNKEFDKKSWMLFNSGENPF